MKSSAREGALALFIVVLSVISATAATYVVRPDGLGDYPTIQAAVDAAGDGDIIELVDGSFTGDGNRDILVPSRDITIRSQSGDPMECAIDCEGSARAEHRAFRFVTDVGTGDVSLEGIAIVNGYTTTHGGGIWIEGADTEITNCIVAQCTADGVTTRGGGVYVSDGAEPHVSGCLIAECATGYGGGLAVFIAGGTFDNCSITDNVATHTAGGVYTGSASDVEFNGCSIVSNDSNRAGGVRLHGSNAQLNSCDISRNEATYGHGGGIWLQEGSVTNCTLVENSALQDGGGVYCDMGTGTLTRCIIAYTEDGHGVAATAGNEPTLSCCDVYGNVGGNYDQVVGDQTGVNDNFSLDPELCGLALGDYRLYDTSPCLDGASPCGLLIGAYGQGCDSPVEELGWGALKAIWRK